MTARVLPAWLADRVSAHPGWIVLAVAALMLAAGLFVSRTQAHD